MWDPEEDEDDPNKYETRSPEEPPDYEDRR